MLDEPGPFIHTLTRTTLRPLLRGHAVPGKGCLFSGRPGLGDLGHQPGPRANIHVNPHAQTP